MDHDWPPDLPPLASEPLGGATSAGRPGGGWPTGNGWWSSAPYPAEAEAGELAALAAAGAPVPAVLGAAGPVLVLEEVGGPPDWPGLGRAIARLHRRAGDRFGWHRDNYQGRFASATAGPTTGRASTSSAGCGFTSPTEVPEPLRQQLERACAGPLPALLRPRPPASPDPRRPVGGQRGRGPGWSTAVSFADRELSWPTCSCPTPSGRAVGGLHRRVAAGPATRSAAPCASSSQHPPLRPRPLRPPDRGRPGRLPPGRPTACAGWPRRPSGRGQEGGDRDPEPVIR